MSVNIDELFDAVMAEVDARFRFKLVDNLLRPPTTMEKQVAIFDALAEINSYPPETLYKLENVISSDGDPRVKSLLYLGTARNVCRTLLMDWTANGFNLQVEEFNVEDRRDRYEQLMSTLTQQFESQLQQYKTSTGKFIKRIYHGDNNPLIRFRHRGPTGPYARFR